MAVNGHDAIVDAVLDVLQAAPALVDGGIAEDIASDTLPTGKSADLSVSLMDSTPGAPGFGKREWTSMVRVTARARSDTAGVNGRTSRAIQAAAFARLMADRTLGGLVLNVGAPRLSNEPAILASRIGVVHADYPVTHYTALNSMDAVQP